MIHNTTNIHIVSKIRDPEYIDLVSVVERADDTLFKQATGVDVFAVFQGLILIKFC